MRVPDPPLGSLGAGVGDEAEPPPGGVIVGSVAPGSPTGGSCTAPTFGDALTAGSWREMPPAGGSVAATTLPTHWLDALSAMPASFAALPSSLIELSWQPRSGRTVTEYADHVKLYVPAVGNATLRSLLPPQAPSFTSRLPPGKVDG